MEKLNKRQMGSSNEIIAASYLKTCGYFIINQNYRVGRLGEIDIIARENEYICFIEVKSRKSLLYGTPAEAVNKKKQDNIRKIAYIYINQHKLHSMNFRFDVVEILIDKKNQTPPKINLIKNAF
ncbi:MAG: YraN family protein [Bacillota bacterium]|nr:YraN family protein [Bacillota bacterium]